MLLIWFVLPKMENGFLKDVKNCYAVQVSDTTPYVRGHEKQLLTTKSIISCNHSLFTI